MPFTHGGGAATRSRGETDGHRPRWIDSQDTPEVVDGAAHRHHLVSTSHLFPCALGSRLPLDLVVSPSLQLERYIGSVAGGSMAKMNGRLGGAGHRGHVVAACCTSKS